MKYSNAGTQVKIIQSNQMNEKSYTAHRSHINHPKLQAFGQTAPKSSNITTSKAPVSIHQSKPTLQSKPELSRSESRSNTNANAIQSSLGKTEMDPEIHKTCHEHMLELQKKITALEKELNVKNERITALEEENKNLKAQFPAAKARQVTQGHSNNLNSMKKESKNFYGNPNGSLKKAYPGNLPKGPHEESKTSSRPSAGLSTDEWKSIQLAQRLEAEERKKQSNSKKAQGNKSRFPNDDINPDNMTYEELLLLEAAMGEVSRGLTKEEIKIIPKYEYKAGEKNCEDKTCSICFCQYEEKEKLRKLQCLHEFHSKCIKTWLMEQKTCPICKVDAIKLD